MAGWWAVRVGAGGTSSGSDDATRCGVVVTGIQGHEKNANNVSISLKKSHSINLNFYFISKLFTTQPFTGGRPNCSSLLFFFD
jgi:hypothetical protein